ncbi:MAG TPA: Rieske 2Fe-2S domain-containing protein, partial [Candidatus Bathyarchaeia archaeon]|nr:Rieske 2Fe-2S domain-containing protein [Candidatus Bathyarchaeia archaeon]
VSDSPYYKNVIARLPDPLVNPFYQNDPILSHVVAFNLTCVHLRCIVNPGYAGTSGSGEFRLQCPCHGSQYRLLDAVPVAGPAYDLGLLPLPRVELKADPVTGNITATNLDGTPGIGRSD